MFIDDGISRATLMFNLQEKTLGLSFVGKLNTLTLAKLTTLSHIPEGFVQGNFRTEIDREKPMRSTAQGDLSGAKIVVPWKEKVSLNIENILLNADKNRINVESASVKLNDNQLSLRGSLNFMEKGIATDMDIAADRLTWETMRKVIEGESKEKDTKKKDYPWNLPLLGMLRLKSNNFIYNKLTISPLHADISLSPDMITITVTEASVCGISTPGSMIISHDNLQCDFNPNARGLELKPTLACLSENKRIVTGRFDFDGSLTAQGKSDQLLQSLNGKINFSAKDGRIYQSVTLAKILSLINVTGILQGGLPDLVKEGFGYRSFILKGDIENGKILLKEAIIDAPSMEIVASGDIDLVKKKMDIKVLVAPFKIVDTVLRNIPLVKNITGRNFVSIPVKVSGDLENPEVSALSPSAIGSGILGIMEKDLSFTNVTLDFEAREVDIPLTRETAFSLVEGAPVVQKIFTFIKGGTVPLIAIHSQGRSIADLGKTENILIKGRIDQGEIFIPGPQFDFKNVKGDCVISRGILDGENIGAKLDNTQLQEGKLKVGLKGADAPLHLDTLAKVNLKELSHLLKRVVKDEAFLRELNGIQNINGYAQGKLVLGKSIASIQPQVDVSEFTLSATYQRIPYSIEIKGGKFSYDGKKVQVKNLSGTVGRSSFSGLTAGLTFGNVPYLEITSGKSSVSLEEIHRWLLSYSNLQSSLKDIPSIKGDVKLSPINFTGPLYRSQDWKFRATGSAENVVLNSPQLPGMLTITGKKIEITPEQLVFTDAQTSMLDASYSISGTLKDPLKGLQNADITFNGAMGPKTAQWIKEIIKLPALRTDQRFSFSQSHLQWEKSGNVFFQGNVKAQNGADVSIDVIKTTRGLTINKLFIDDGISRATLMLHLQEKTLGLSFVGKLNTLTLAKLTTLSDIPDGFVQGNFRTEIDREKPMRSTAQGDLSGAKIVIPWKEKVSLNIENIFLNADKNRINVESASVKLNDNQLSLRGSLNFMEKGIATDMDIAADRLTWETMRKVIEGENKEKDTKKKDYPWNLPLLGMLRLKSNNFIYNKLTISPLHADISLSPDMITITVTEASVCGISTPGSMIISHDNLQCDFNPNARGLELKPTLACLSENKRIVTGRFDFDGSLTAQGKSDQLLQSLNGKINFSAKDGRIYQSVTLAKILSLINVTGILQGGLPDLVKEGFGYRSFILKGDIENGKILLKEAVIDAPSMEIVASGDIDLVKKKMDLKVLVAPFKIVDTVLRNIPLVKNITGRNFVSIPVKVSGDLENPEVSALSPSAIGSGILGIMEKILEAPVHVIQPLIPGDKKNQ